MNLSDKTMVIKPVQTTPLTPEQVFQHVFQALAEKGINQLVKSQEISFLEIQRILQVITMLGKTFVVSNEMSSLKNL